jgi:hypothetical protein
MTQLWQVSLFLADADKLPGNVQRFVETPVSSLAAPASYSAAADQPR